LTRAFGRQLRLLWDDALSGAQTRAVIGKARATFFGTDKPPASTLVGVAALAMPEWLIEIEAIAVVD
jgi:enamine deaminase RidA (YjgF/YER057c/UK114 family)